MAHRDRPLLVMQGGHHAHQLLQEHVSRGEQQIEQDQRLADASQQSPRPVQDGGSAAAVFDLYRRRFLLFLPFLCLRSAEVVNRRCSLAETLEKRKSMLNALTQVGKALRG